MNFKIVNVQGETLNTMLEWELFTHSPLLFNDRELAKDKARQHSIGRNSMVMVYKNNYLEHVYDKGEMLG